MTSDLDSHTATDVKPDMLSGVQTGNGIPHDEYNINGIAHAHTNRKDDIFMQRQLHIWVDFPSRDKNLHKIGKLQFYNRCHAYYLGV